MAGGQAHGADRAYQEMCRDICIQRSGNTFRPYQGTDGIDVAFEVGGTVWRFDVVLENGNGDLLVAECKRWAAAVPQKEIVVVAHNVESLRAAMKRAVAGLLFAKTHVQSGALKAAAYEAIEVVVADEGQPVPTSFSIVVLRYDANRDAILQHHMHSVTASVVLVDSCDAVFQEKNE
jgi:hypothetical protein